ncbi:MAG: hypothetical protein F6K62_24300 [Sphaerospermopsis sp. SIO1G2]|nr:hypothetical protein [Sphaerospermopsis sp. SIO1G2]
MNHYLHIYNTLLNSQVFANLTLAVTTLGLTHFHEILGFEIVSLRRNDSIWNKFCVSPEHIGRNTLSIAILVKSFHHHPKKSISNREQNHHKNGK